MLCLGTNLQQMLSEEIVARLSLARDCDKNAVNGVNGLIVSGELSEKQIYSAFHDALFCFEEAKKIQR